MTKEEIIEELETLRLNLLDNLSYINAKHDAITQQLAFVNGLLYRAKRSDDNAGEITEKSGTADRS